MCQSMRAAQTTAKPLPPWLLDLAATPASIPKMTTTTTTTTVATTGSTPASMTSMTSTSVVVTEEASTVVVEVPAPSRENMTEKSHPERTLSIAPTLAPEEEAVFDRDDHHVQVLVDMSDHCPPQTVRNLFWNWTENGREAIQLCPPGSSGFARWSCSHDGSWLTGSPNLAECQSLWLSRLESRMHAAGSLDSISSELAALTEAKSLYGGDLAVVTAIVRGLAHRLRQELYIIASQEEKEIKVAELMQNALKTASNLLDKAQVLAWSDLSLEKRASHASSLMLGMEENAILLAENINNEKNMIEATNNVLASIRVMRARDMVDQSFPQVEHVHWEADSNLLLPASGLVTASENGAVRIAFFLYNNLEGVLEGTSGDVTRFINSKIMGASVSKGRGVRLARPAHFVLRHLQSEGFQNPSCASWDFAGHTWDTKHCRMTATNATHSHCACSIVSHYALLAEERPMSASPHADTKSPSSSSDVLAPHLSVVLAVAAAIALAAIFVILLVLAVRRFDLKPRVQKFVQANGVFRCKKSDSTTSSCGFYPPLTSSPTSTNVSSGTPTNQTYLEQVLKGHMTNPPSSEYQGVVLPQQPAAQQQPESEAPARTIYRTMNTPGRHLVALNQYDPFGHHIYMEIDPVYARLDAAVAAAAAAAADAAQQSDIQLSDISDEDARRLHNGGSSRQPCFPEERPLIRQPLRLIQDDFAVGGNNHSSSSSPAVAPRHFMTSHRGFKGSSSSNNNNGSLRQARTAQRSGRPRLQQQQQPLLYPVVSSQANGSALDTPITIALQGGEQFVSLKIDQQKRQQQRLQDKNASAY